MRKIAIAASLLLFTSLSPAFAATTQADADKIKADLKAQYGAVADLMTVAPEGDGYHIKLDLSSFFDKVKNSNGQASMTPIEFSLQPDGKGNWKGTHDGPFELNVNMPGTLNLVEKFESLKWAGLFDTASGILANSQAEAKNGIVKEDFTDPKSGNKVGVDATIASIGQTLTATPSPGGGVDAVFSEPLGAIQMSENFTDPNGQPVTLKFNVADGQFDGKFSGLRASPFLGLWRFAAAHPDKASMAKDQAELKTILSSAIPVWNAVSTSGSFGKTEVLTPLGSFTMDKIGFSLAMNGLVKDGKLEEGFSAEGLAPPPGVVPPWASSLVPKKFNIGYGFSGFDLESPAKEFISAADFSQDKPISDAENQKLAALALPAGSVKVSLSKSAISSDTYTLTAEGEMTAGPVVPPSGHGSVSIKGLDDVMRAVQAAPPEANLKDVVSVIILAKGLAKPGADGTLVWDIDATPDGKVLINGTDVKSIGK